MEKNSLARGIRHDYERLEQTLLELQTQQPGRTRFEVTDKFGRTTRYERCGNAVERYDGRVLLRYEVVSDTLHHLAVSGVSRREVRVLPDGSASLRMG